MCIMKKNSQYYQTEWENCINIQFVNLFLIYLNFHKFSMSLTRYNNFNKFLSSPSSDFTGSINVSGFFFLSGN